MPIRISYLDENGGELGHRDVREDEPVIDSVLQATGGWARIYPEPSLPHVDSVDILMVEERAIWTVDIHLEAREFPETTAWFGFNVLIELLDKDKARYEELLGVPLSGTRPINENPSDVGIWEWINIGEPSFVITAPLQVSTTFGELHDRIRTLECLFAERVVQVETLSANVQSAPRPDIRRWQRKAFICHSSRDKAFARKLATELRKEGIEVWIDEEQILVGHDFTTKLEEGLKDADFIIVVLSPNFVQYGPWAQEEYRQALSRQVSEQKIRILPVLVKECDIPPLLKTKHYADFRSHFPTGLRRLVASIRRHQT
jgi:hypothetical protein